MRYKVHPYVGWVALGVAIGSLLGVAGVVVLAVKSTTDEALVVLGAWAMGLWWVAVICGIIASHTLPNHFERKHAVRHAQRLVDATSGPQPPRTPDHP